MIGVEWQFCVVIGDDVSVKTSENQNKSYDTLLTLCKPHHLSAPSSIVITLQKTWDLLENVTIALLG